MPESETIPLRIDVAVMQQAKARLDDFVPLNAAIGMLVREVVTGNMAAPAPPARAGSKANVSSVRLRSDVWTNPASGETVDKALRRTLITDLIHALAEGRVSVTVAIKGGEPVDQQH